MTTSLAHYEELGEKYDQLWSFTHCYKEDMLKNIVKELELAPTDHLLDVGGGSGEWASAIYFSAKLQHNVVNVEPSHKLIETSLLKQGVDAYEGDIDTYLKKPNIKFDKCILKESIYYIDYTNVKLWKRLHLCFS